MSFHIRSPSNIALLKYMGKTDEGMNLPANPSLSLTLNSLSTHLLISKSGDQPLPLAPPLRDEWKKAEAFSLPGESPDLDEKSIDRYLGFLARLRREVGAIRSALPCSLIDLEIPVTLSSTNTFPHSAGIASSASAFSALTLGFFTFYSGNSAEFSRFAATEAGKRLLSSFARKGSGSSCRSFQGPFVSWEGEEAFQIPSNLPKLVDLILIAGKTPKKVSSSEAHRRVMTSPLWDPRQRDIYSRHAHLKSAIADGDFELISEIAYGEFLEMHELFHTAREPFSYWNELSRELLQTVKEDFPRLKKQAIFTMDAGPNLHCLVREGDAGEMKSWWKQRFPNLEILEDSEGSGAEVLS